MASISICKGRHLAYKALPLQCNSTKQLLLVFVDGAMDSQTIRGQAIRLISRDDRLLELGGKIYQVQYSCHNQNFWKFLNFTSTRSLPTAYHSI